jgi:spermidine dehydrogenase
MKRSNKRLEDALGMNASIPRRDFLNGILLGLGGLWSPALSPLHCFAHAQTDGITSKAQWGGDAAEVFAIAHKLRDGAYDDPNIEAEETGEVFDLVVIGGGLSGLAAAYYFNQAREGRSKVLVLESHRMFGGNARRDEFVVKGKELYAPQGSIVAQELPPALTSLPQVEGIFQELKVDFEKIRVPKESSTFSVFWDQRSHRVRWYANLFEAPLTAAVKKDLLEFAEGAGRFYENPAWRAELLHLDRFTFKEHVEKQRKWHPELFRTMLPDLVSFFGFPDAVSAAAVYAQYGGGPRPLYFFPGGNSGFVRQLIKGLIPDAIVGETISAPINFAALDRRENSVRIRTDAIAVRVEHEGRPDEAKHVRVTFSRGGKLYRLRARGAIMASGGYVTKHIVRGMPVEKREAYDKFVYVPVLWINVAMNNSRALDRAGINFLSTYHGGFGVMLAFYEKMSASSRARRDSDRPNVIGIGAPRFYPGLSPQAQSKRGRLEILETPFRNYELKVRQELVRLLGPWGFDPKKDIAAITISRWGHHGYIFPYPGFFTDGMVALAKRPFGRIAFAHTDLSRFSHMMGAIEQGYRAVQELLKRI